MKLFHMQISIQCKFGLLAYSELNEHITNLAEVRERAHQALPLSLAGLPHDEWRAQALGGCLDTTIGPWHAIQAFLTSVANISKALWGQGGKYTAQREPLRVSLNVDDSSPLKQTSMRNNFDHFDERLDAWWDISQNRNYVDLSLGNLVISGMPEEELFRSYVPSTGDLIFWGKRYNLPSIVAELERIIPIALREA